MLKRCIYCVIIFLYEICIYLEKCIFFTKSKERFEEICCEENQFINPIDNIPKNEAGKTLYKSANDQSE